MLREELFDGYSVYCDVIPMGKDYTLAVYGGDTPHVGSVVLSIARPSLAGEGIGVTSSVLSGVGHKDEPSHGCSRKLGKGAVLYGGLLLRHPMWMILRPDR